MTSEKAASVHRDEKMDYYHDNKDRAQAYGDEEQQHENHVMDDDEDARSEVSYDGRFPFLHRNRQRIRHLFVFLVCTGLFIPAVIMRKEGNVLVLSILYAA